MRHSPGDIVVVVPRGMIIAVGLLLLLIELTFSFTFLFLGFATEGIFLSLFVMILAPLQLLILYIVWRFYWYLLVLGVMLQSLLTCAAVTGVARIGGNTYSILGGSSMRQMGDALATTVLFAFVLALLAVIVIAVLVQMFMPSPVPRVNYDPYDLDKPPPPRPRRKSNHRDLWEDD